MAAGRKSFANPMTVEFERVTVPRSPMSSSTTPCHASRPASVTTKDGIPIFVMSRPCSVPIAAPAATAMMIAGTAPIALPSSSSSSAVMTPATPLTKPTDRSISPSSSTNTRPMPIVM